MKSAENRVLRSKSAQIVLSPVSSPKSGPLASSFPLSLVVYVCPGWPLKTQPSEGLRPNRDTRWAVNDSTPRRRGRCNNSGKRAGKANKRRGIVAGREALRVIYILLFFLLQLGLLRVLSSRHPEVLEVRCTYTFEISWVSRNDERFSRLWNSKFPPRFS